MVSAMMKPTLQPAIMMVVTVVVAMSIFNIVMIVNAFMEIKMFHKINYYRITDYRLFRLNDTFEILTMRKSKLKLLRYWWDTFFKLADRMRSMRTNEILKTEISTTQMGDL